MPADLTLLVPEFRTRTELLLANCASRGVVMRPYFGLRDPFTQAKLWRQSRSIEEIRAKILDFRAKNAFFLADCLESVGPQQGERVTNAPPGLSWHQWGEAVDCFWLVDDKAEWSDRRLVNGMNGYRVYAEKALRIGVEAGGLWSRLKDWPHVQLGAASSPLKIISLKEIDRIMQERFGNV